MNEKRPLSNLDQEQNLSKKKKIEVLDDVSSAKFNYKHHVLREINNSTDSDRIVIHCEPSKQEMIYSWLQAHEVLKIMEVNFQQIPEGILIQGVEPVSRLKSWQKMNYLMGKAFIENNWEKVFHSIGLLKADNKYLGVKTLLNLLEIYYKQLLSKVPEEERGNFGKTYQIMRTKLEKAYHDATVNVVEKTAEQKNAKEVVSDKTTSFVDNRFPFNPISTMEKSASNPTFFNNVNFGMLQPFHIKKSGVPTIIDLSDSEIQSSNSSEIIATHAKSFSSNLINQERSPLKKEELKEKSLEDLVQMKQRMMNTLYTKRMEEAKSILFEIRATEIELGTESDPRITLEDNLSYDLLKQKTAIFKNKLNELKVQLKNKLIGDILSLGKEFTSNSNEQNTPSFGK